MTLKHKIVRRWTRMMMPLRYESDNVVRCWCGGSLGPSRSPLVGECVECGTGVLRRRLTEVSYERWYRTGTYRLWVLGTAEVSVHQLAKEIRRTESALHWLHYVGHPLGNTSVLDVGCGAGGALIACRIRGAASVAGVDIDARSHLITGQFGIEVFGCVPSMQYERIWCSHLIEHVLDPVGFLRTLRDHLKNVDWSYIYLETPAWTEKAEIKLPHPFYYSPASFRFLTERAGLKVAAMDDGIRAVLRRAK